jgi:zinc transport system substrate-binding protein
VNNKKIVGTIIGIIFVAALSYALKAWVFSKKQTISTNQENQTKKVNVVASFFPLADFAKNIGGDYVTVTNITPAGAEPHDYEPTPQDIAKVYDSQLFIMNGNGVDAWGEKIQGDLEVKGVTVVKMSDTLASLKNNSPDEPSLQYDPHFWLNPINAEKEVNLITDALVKIDPAHKGEYNQNRDAYEKQLADLDQEYKTGLSMCKQHEIVTSHNAFNYMASQYGLTTLYILGLSPDEEPSPKAIADIATEAKQKGIKYIFFESLVSPKLAQTVASEIGAQTLELNPIEGFTDEEVAAGKNYLSQMKANLANLKIALQCQ